MRKYLMPRSFAAALRSITLPLIAPPSALACRAGNPARSRERHACHRSRFDRKCHQILGFEIAHVALPASARDRLDFERHDGKEIGEPPAAEDGVEPRRKACVLRRDAGGI